MDAAVIGISPGLGEREEKLSSVSITLDLNTRSVLSGGMRDIVVVGPSHGSADGYRNRLWTESKIPILSARCCRARFTRRRTP